MELWSEIRRRVLTGELSLRQACSEYGLNFRTVRKIVHHSEPPPFHAPPHAFAWDDLASWLNPYPADYRPALACSLLLYPPPRRRALRHAVPCGRTTGLPRFAVAARVGKVAALRRWCSICVRGSHQSRNRTLWGHRQKDEAAVAAADFPCQDLRRKLTGKRPSDSYFKDASRLADMILQGGFEAIAGVPREEILMKYENR